MNFEEIYNSTFSYVYKYFYYKSVNKSYIEDLSHEVFFRFYRKFKDQHLEVSEAKRILFGFCRNVYKEWVRQSIKEKRETFFDNYDYDKDDEDQYEDFVNEEREKHLEEQKELVLKAMEKLNPKMKLILEYRFIHKMTRKEIAEKLDMKEKDVHTYQKRGVRYLRKIIENK